jgi:hypothetical protein
LTSEGDGDVEEIKMVRETEMVRKYNWDRDMEGDEGRRRYMKADGDIELNIVD